ncbi:hypothetical protein MKX67_08405 [Cytobacillus sp. FSL W7-1323]|uniref:hypothetical protein n=1 Tax=Cytobacillus sp. FSL W7-1323 TaxID=2921700 RepID=UPI0031592280
MRAVQIALAGHSREVLHVSAVQIPLARHSSEISHVSAVGIPLARHSRRGFLFELRANSISEALK